MDTVRLENSRAPSWHEIAPFFWKNSSRESYDWMCPLEGISKDAPLSTTDRPRPYFVSTHRLFITYEHIYHGAPDSSLATWAVIEKCNAHHKRKRWNHPPKAAEERANWLNVQRHRHYILARPVQSLHLEMSRNENGLRRVSMCGRALGRGYVTWYKNSLDIFNIKRIWGVLVMLKIWLWVYMKRYDPLEDWPLWKGVAL